MPVIIPGPGGLVTTDQAAALCGVEPVTVRNWIYRGWHDPAGSVRKLSVARRDGGRILLDPVEVAKAELATRKRARRDRSFAA